MAKSPYQPELPFHNGSDEITHIQLPLKDGSYCDFVCESTNFIRGQSPEYAVRLGELATFEIMPESTKVAKTTLTRLEAAAIVGKDSRDLPDGDTWVTRNVIAHALNPWVMLEPIVQ